MVHSTSKDQGISAHIGRQLQKRRKKVGCSLEDLASKIGISHQQLHKYEKAVNKIPSDKLYYLSTILDVPYDYFFEGFVDKSDEENIVKRGEALSILIIEDDPGDALLMRKALEACEKENKVHFAYDGREALSFLNSSCTNGATLPDIIFLDLNIPSITGLSLLKEIKNHSNLSTIPIIVVTNSMDDSDIIRSYRSHASGVIRKTGDRQEFNKHISSIVDCWSSAMTIPVN